MSRLWQWYLGPQEKRMSDEEREALRPIAWAMCYVGSLYTIGSAAVLIWHYCF